MSYIKLKSGTDVRGTAMGENADLTPEAASDIAAAFAYWLGKENPRVAVGRDSRLTGLALLSAIKNRLVRCGCEVFDCSLCSTPSMFMMTKFKQTACDGAIMITASHHPSDKNGLKFFTGKGGLSSDELGAVLALADGGKSPVGKGSVREGDFLGLYCEHIKSEILSVLPNGLNGFKVAVDAGSGAGGFFATRILAELGADVSGSQYLEPDGNFPFHQPNPENKQAMDSISRRVKETHSDLGIIFDTDVDRSAIVTASGKEINRNRLIAMISDMILREQKGAYIVTDSVTSDGLTEFIEHRGGVHVRYKRGYRNVIDYAQKLCGEGKNAPLAIETSGHAAFKDNYFLDDGAYLAVRLLVEAVKLKGENKSLDSLITDLSEPVEEAEIRLKLTGENWKEKGEAILKEIESRSENLVPSFEGVRARTPYGFYMARMSVHDPIIPVNIECSVSGGLSKTAEFLADILSGFDIDLSGLKALIKQ